MTLHLRSNSGSEDAEDGAAGAEAPTCSTSSSSTEVYNFPLGQQGQIDISHENQHLVSLPNDLHIGGANNNYTFNDSPYPHIGDVVNIQGQTIHVTTFNGVERSIQNGSSSDVPAIGPQPSVDSPKKPAIGIGLIRRYFRALIIIITTITLICAVALITLSFIKPNSDGGNLISTTSTSTTTTTTEDPSTITTTEQNLIHYMFNRSAWGAREPTEPPVHMEPPGLVIIKHTNTESCSDVPSCFAAMKELQNADVGEHGLPDIRYNFVIGGDGNMYEGRGWTVQNAQRNNSLDVAFMGNFNVQVPSAFLAVTGPWLVIKGINQGYLDWGPLRIVCHNQTEDTDSPGEFMYREVVQWLYYSDDIIK